MKSNAVWWLTVVLPMVLAAVQVLHAGTLDTQIIALFPKDVGEFAYVDMETAQQHKWFPKLQQQILPAQFSKFETFLKSAGIDINSQVEDLAFAAIPANDKHPEEVIGVAEGKFHPETTEAYLKRQKLSTRKSSGYTLYAFGSGDSPYKIFFFFLNPNTAVFGQADAIDKMISVNMNGDPSLLANDTLSPLINQVNGRGPIWAVLDQHYTRLGLKQLLPEVASAQQSSALFQKIKAIIISVDTSPNIQTQFEAVCATPDDANNFGALVQAGILYRRYLARQSNPQLANMLDRAQVTPRGNWLELNFQLTEEQMAMLIKKGTFTVKPTPIIMP